ncbi:MAG TPA: hypothetical protein VJ810_06890 [Blastocatellia bacterium]|nr:hypothetical protein [Blastocatellia bacterium]
MTPKSIAAVIMTITALSLAAGQAAAQSVSIGPGQGHVFSAAVNGASGTNAGGVQSGGHGFATSPPTVKASAELIGVADMSVTSFAEVYNDFTVTGVTPRAVSAQVSANADWNGLLNATGVAGAKASVEITLTLRDQTDGRDVASAVIFEDDVSGGTFGSETSNAVGSRQVNFQANVTRGHSFRLIFRIECRAETGLLIGGSSSIFFPVGNSSRQAKLSSLTVLIGPDQQELLETILTTVSALTDEIATIKVIVQNTNTLINQRLDVAVSTRASQVSVDNVQNTVNVINAKVDDLAGKLMKFQADSLRSSIEAALVEGDRYNVAWYQTPTEANGHLNLVRSIVQETINNAANAGAPDFSGTSLNQARRELALGDVFRAAGNYKDAYDHYRAAYLHLSIVPGNHRP